MFIRRWLEPVLMLWVVEGDQNMMSEIAVGNTWSIKKQSEKWVGEIHTLPGWLLNFTYANGDYAASFHKTYRGALAAAHNRSRRRG